MQFTTVIDHELNELDIWSKKMVKNCDSCGIGNSHKLEQLKLEDDRIVTGSPIFTNKMAFSI